MLLTPFSKTFKRVLELGAVSSLPRPQRQPTIILAIHDLDIARWLMGSRGANEPVRVYATGACNVDKSILELKDSNPSEAIDTANILIEFESGSTATIQVSTRER